MSTRQDEKSHEAADILRNRYVGADREREASLEDERLNARVARMIYKLRTRAGMTQRQLAELAGTTQSVISRLEDTDYAGHSLTMLDRIAKALGYRLHVQVLPEDAHRPSD